MKQVRSNGIVFEVRDISEPLVVFEGSLACPTPLILPQIVTDEQARALTKKMIESKSYRRTT